VGSLVQDSSPLTLTVAALLGVIGVARATRLWVYDAWPPVQWARHRFLDWTDRGKQWRSGWAPLATCPFCVAPWFALGSLAWAYASGLHGLAGAWWWFLHLWFAAAYVASMIVVRDEPPEDS
jgi:hypothetical protein